MYDKREELMHKMVEDYSEIIKDCAALLKEDSSIRNRLSFAEKEFAPFAEYLD